MVTGSHRLGRIDHGKVGDQTGADPERAAGDPANECELVHCELEPGSAIFFHGNLLHRSDQNKSPDPRWAFICCYNAKRTTRTRNRGDPRYTPLEKWDDDRVR